MTSVSVQEIGIKKIAVIGGGTMGAGIAQAASGMGASVVVRDISTDQLKKAVKTMETSLSRIVKKAYSIEIIEPLGKAVSKIFAPLGYDNVETRVGDGYFGWPEVKDGFDVIIVTCAAQYAPPDLFKQLKPGGRMLIPIGQPFKRGQILYVYTKDAEGKVHSRKDVGVFFIPMTGAMMKNPRPAGVSAPAPAAPAPATVGAEEQSPS